MTDHAPTLLPAVQANLADPRYTQRDRREIVRVLRRLVANQVPVLLVGAGEGDVLHTTLLDLAADERSLFFEWGPDDEATQRLIEDGVAVSCQAEVDQVRLHFAIEPTLGRLHYRKVLRARVPELMFRVQRREYYRLPIVPADGVACTVLLRRLLTAGLAATLARHGRHPRRARGRQRSAQAPQIAWYTGDLSRAVRVETIVHVVRRRPERRA